MRNITILCFLLLASAGRANLVPTNRGFYDHERELRDAFYGVEIPLNDTSSQSKQVFIAILAGAAYTEVEVIGSPGLDPKALAMPLDEWNRLNGQTKAVVQYTRAEGLSEAHTSLDFSRVFQSSATNLVTAGTLIELYKRAGFVPTCFERIPSYIGGEDPMARTLSKTSSRTIEDVSSFTPVDATTISVDLKGTLRSGPTFLLLFIPLWSALVCLGVWGIYRMPSKATLKKRKLVERFAAYASNLGFGSHFLIGLWLMMPGRFTPALDLWFGSRDSLLTVSALTFPPFLFLPIPVHLASTLGKRISSRFYSGGLLRQPTRLYRASRYYIRYADAFVLALAFTCVIVASFMAPARLLLIGYPIATYLAFSWPKAANRFLAQLGPKLSERYPSDKLVAVVDRAADLMGVRVRGLGVASGAGLRGVWPALFADDSVRIEYPQFDTLTDEEKEFALILAMCDKDMRRPVWTTYASLCITAIVLSIGAASIFNDMPRGSTFFVAPLGTLVNYSLLGSKKKSPAEMWREALSTSGNLSAAEGFVEKFEVDDASLYGGEEVKRSKIMRANMRNHIDKAAKELGLS